MAMSEKIFGAFENKRWDDPSPKKSTCPVEAPPYRRDDTFTDFYCLESMRREIDFAGYKVYIDIDGCWYRVVKWDRWGWEADVQNVGTVTPGKTQQFIVTHEDRHLQKVA